MAVDMAFNPEKNVWEKPGPQAREPYLRLVKTPEQIKHPFAEMYCMKYQNTQQPPERGSILDFHFPPDPFYSQNP